ncbi:MAG: 23S rRNA (adenine(2503)-C(2))-methyltransferase RlmN [Thermodesulfobacteriota bacterium]|nr:23S rRNA (adenine(2503)-C(2))-methyltransferase RlmN [Thermodesulfobacteriota bacterium]
MSARLDITNFSDQGLMDWFQEHGIAAYRAGQVMRWIYHKRVRSFFQMTDLSKDMRQWLSERLTVSRLKPIRVQTSMDGSKKYLFRLNDGHCIETVAIPERGHWTLCVSSQVGCAMGCKLCLTGRGGLVRNLEPAEIIGQVCTAQEDHAHQDPITNIVFMGMGEPLANYNSVVQALGTITGANGLQFSNRRVTVSTAGLVPQLDQLGRDMTVNLAVSLNAADNKTRDRVMPVNRTYPIETLLGACRRFPLPSGRMITFEYVLIGGVNDGLEDAKRLARLLRPLHAKINLIPFNPFAGSPFKRPEEAHILAFQKVLIDRHYTATIRQSKGADIRAACGQLRATRDPIQDNTGQPGFHWQQGPERSQHGRVGYEGRGVSKD